MTMVDTLLLPHHLENLKSSCISDELLDEYRDLIFSVHNQRVLLDSIGRKSWPPGVKDGLGFRYPGTDHIRIKTFFHDEADAEARKIRYLLRHGEKPRLYVTMAAQKILKDVGQVICLCEGEKKALALASQGLSPIAFGGSWAHLSKGQPLADFDGVAWATRTVKIYLDSNTSHKFDIRQGLYVLGMELASRRADVVMIQVPMHGPDQDQGVDDFIHGGGDLSQLPEVPLKEFAKETKLKEWYATWKKKQKAQTAKEEVKERKPVVPPIPEDEITEEARVLLADPDIITKFLDMCKLLGAVGEDNALTMLLLAMTSRLLPRPINLAVKAQSSSGKNFICGVVAQTMPPKEIHMITAMSPKALYHLDSDLSHSILLIAEAQGGDESDYSLRSLMSEGELVLYVVESDKGKMRTERKVVHGPICFISSTTRATLHAENETRFFDLNLDESDEQTRRIHQQQDKEAMGLIACGPDEIKRQVLVWQRAQEILVPHEIIIPFARQITMPQSPVRLRRDRPRVFSLVAASCLLHQHQREKDEKGRLIATLHDYAIIRPIVIPSLETAVKGVKPKTEYLVGVASEWAKKMGQAVPFTKADLKQSDATVNRWARDTLDDALTEAEEVGCIEYEQKPRQGVQNKYIFLRGIDDAMAPLPDPKDLSPQTEDQLV